VDDRLSDIEKVLSAQTTILRHTEEHLKHIPEILTKLAVNTERSDTNARDISAMGTKLRVLEVDHKEVCEKQAGDIHTLIDALDKRGDTRLYKGLSVALAFTVLVGGYLHDRVAGIEDFIMENMVKERMK